MEDFCLNATASVSVNGFQADDDDVNDNKASVSLSTTDNDSYLMCVILFSG